MRAKNSRSDPDKMIAWSFLVALFFSLFLTASTVAAEPDNNPRSIFLNSTHSQDLVANQTLSFEFAAQANKSYLIEVDQGGLDLVVTVADPAGKSTAFNSPLLRDESELVFIETDEAGIFTISLLSNEYTGATALISIQISEVLPRAGVRQERLKALRLISAASAADHLNNIEDRNSALEAYQQVIIHLRKTSEKRLLARSLFSIAIIEYWHTSKWDYSAALASQAAEIYRENGDCDSTSGSHIHRKSQ